MTHEQALDSLIIDPRWALSVDEVPLDFSDPLIPALPGESVVIALHERPGVAPRTPVTSGTGSELRFEQSLDLTWRVSGGALTSTGGLNSARWELPTEPGTQSLVIRDTQGRGVRLDVQVLTPFDRSGPGAIDGYPLGVYANEAAPNVPGPVARRPEAYTPPTHFWHVTEANRDRHLSPHVRLGDLCTAPLVNGEAHIAISPTLVEKLEALHAACVARGWIEEGDEGGLTILRAYLSPNHLRQLQQAGLRISDFTRHLYGDGAMVIVDTDGDRRMDDLNGDGAIDVIDAERLADEVEVLEMTIGRGGIGIYAERPAGDPELPQTPMVQFDCRGERARW